jgi:hopanoid biosynthesis associated protein HpnK
VKRLIVNADDFGLTPGVDRAIAEAHRQGIVTSATLMANGAAFEDAIHLAAGVPTLAIGCHVDLIQLSPVLPPEKVRTLTDGGHFRAGLARFAAAALRGRIDGAEVAAEAAAQMRKLQSAGVKLSHFDTHKHTHVFPPVLKALLRAAKECGVRAVRNPFEPESAAGFRQAVRRWGMLSRWAAVQSLRTLAADFRRQVERAGLATTDGTVGVALTGHMDQNMLCDLFQHLPHGTWELVTHPGHSDPGLARLSRLTTSREGELRWLTSAETRAAIGRAGIELISYADLGRR